MPPTIRPGQEPHLFKRVRKGELSRSRHKFHNGHYQSRLCHPLGSLIHIAHQLDVHECLRKGRLDLVISRPWWINHASKNRPQCFATLPGAQIAFEHPNKFTRLMLPSTPELAIPTSQLRRFPSSGPPPSSRRGQSSLYSTVSLVSPIPEEGLGHRVHGSYASSTAMPDNLRADSGTDMPSNKAAQYELTLNDESGDSIIDQYGDERSLVFGIQNTAGPSAAALAHSDHAIHKESRSLPPPINPFNGGSVFMDVSTDSSNTSLTNKHTLATSPGTASNLVPTPNTMLKASGSLSPPDPAELRKASGSPQPVRRLSAMRRPPRLDMDAVRAAEARGSLTSLSDLILRATKLAAMIDKGKRPSSRLDDLDYFEEKSSVEGEKRTFMHERQPSGLSDMLAAFPPPVHTPQNGPHRGSSFWTGSWPVLPGTREREMIPDELDANIIPKKQRRRCCGLPVWAFILVIVLILCIIAAAVVLPLEFFVFKNLGQKRSSGMTLQDCQKSLTCLNGGTNVVFQNTCSCICTNGFTGASCSVGGSAGCTTTNLVATDGSSRINNVTLGRAIPRIIADSTGNFSIPLSGTTILAKLNSANLSCIAQNSLLTFDGQSTRVGEADAPVQDNSGNSKAAVIKTSDDFVSVSVLTSPPTTTTTTAPVIARRSPQSPDGSVSAPAPSAPEPTATFTVTEEVLDFARTAVLYVLQEENVDAASIAQTELQQFFSRASMGQIQRGSQVTIQDALNLNIGGNSTVDLVAASVNIGQGPIGGKKSLKRNVASVSIGDHNALVIFDGPGQPILPRGLKACR
ncbi:hypothetical protein PT974_03318 [Cladobotryum mycophilum]|uniref:EGF-like domain-containing protein n=1 Tax=Cladobotryum mycophilum TaxID=491253 RepID=A0ABR0SRY4_9HYPO